MHQRKSKKILIYIFLLILVGSVNNISLNNLKFSDISDINIIWAFAMVGLFSLTLFLVALNLLEKGARLRS